MRPNLIRHTQQLHIAILKLQKLLKSQTDTLDYT